MKKKRKAVRKNPPKKPWLKEPDRKEGEYKGYEWLILRAPLGGNLCGYVGIPRKHRLYRKDYERIDLAVHGGLTFGTMGGGDRWPKKYWWIGFDCAHGGDLMPSMKDHLPSALLAGLTYKDMAYVESETESLIDQIVEKKYRLGRKRGGKKRA